MKSQMSQLRNRGFLTKEDLVCFRQLSTKSLIQQLESADAVERTGAIRLLAMTSKTDISLHRIFVQRLTQETKLYTKLELCEALQSGGVESARLLIPLLGQIGRNQHKLPAPERFKKSSYPLPRDIVARVLARMDACVLPLLVLVARDGVREQIVEAIDAMGFMCFYSAVPPTEKLAALQQLLDSYRANRSDELLRWKIVRAFESFNHPDTLSMLGEIIDDGAKPEILQEAQRSLALAVKQPLM